MLELIDIAILQLVTVIRNGQCLSCNVVKQFKNKIRLRIVRNLIGFFRYFIALIKDCLMIG